LRDALGTNQIGDQCRRGPVRASRLEGSVMRLGDLTMKDSRKHLVLTLGVCLVLLAAGTAAVGDGPSCICSFCYQSPRPKAGKAAIGNGRSRQPHGTVSREYYEARALFEKLWEPGEASPSGGDGVGPLYNEESCVGCHNQGGTGGAGDISKNVTILSALPGASLVRNGQSIFQGELEDLHPGFRNRSNIVLHQHSTNGSDRLSEIRTYTFVQTRDELFALAKSQRSTPALFGAGRIDTISDQALLAAEARKFPDFPEIKGRVSRLRGDRLGKFGWKGQTASLEDFVMAACANELGLEVRGHHQASLLSAKDYDPKKISLDLSDEDCTRMIRFVANLPAPVVHPTLDAEWGYTVFHAIGCATCHAPSMGGVSGLYSDLLLHDLGDRFRAFGGGYGGGTSEIVEKSSRSKDAATPSGEAGPTEWRTTPLWGVAASAPYLHDGRASTLHEAIILHGGEAEMTSKRYSQLDPGARQALLAFLRSQVAPSQPGRSVDQTVRNSRGSRR
jgi:CxxC motif-containing protein (DUF1111 family)